MQVKSFSSWHYTSHRRVPECIAALFDTWLPGLYWGGRIDITKKINSLSFEYFNKLSWAFVHLIKRSILARGISCLIIFTGRIVVVQKYYHWHSVSKFFWNVARNQQPSHETLSELYG
jgi:hypothetical protein